MLPSKGSVVVLVDNMALRNDLRAEHGLSLWIEVDELRILFDTGQSSAFAKNAERLKVRCERAEAVVLSHGHFDHSGGLPLAMKRASTARLFLHPDAVLLRYSLRGQPPPKPIGMPRDSASMIRRIPNRLTWTRTPTAIRNNVWVTGPIPRETRFEDTGGPFYLDPEGRRADPIEDDLALWINTAEGLVVCVGCCHAGLVNTLNYVRRLSGDSRLRAVIGGFHLLQASDQRLAQTVAALRSMAPEMVVPCHCTGERAVEVLRSVLGKRVLLGRTGVTISFD